MVKQAIADDMLGSEEIKALSPLADSNANENFSTQCWFQQSEKLLV